MVCLVHDMVSSLHTLTNRFVGVKYVNVSHILHWMSS